MTSRANLLDDIQTTSPCSADWASMSGNDQVRVCDHCNLSVYNISSMTRHEAETLITKSRGRLCAKYFRRLDGSVITADKSGSLSPINGRVITGAFTILLTVSSNAISQSIPGKSPRAQPLELSVRKNASSVLTQLAALKGSIVDPNLALISGAKITLTSESNRAIFKTVSNQEGEFQFVSLPAGLYSLAVEADGFSTFAIQHLELKEGEELRFDTKLQIGMPVCEVVKIEGNTGTMGIIAVMQRKGFWQKLLEIVTYPYKQGKKILAH